MNRTWQQLDNYEITSNDLLERFEYAIGYNGFIDYYLEFIINIANPYLPIVLSKIYKI